MGVGGRRRRREMFKLEGWKKEIEREREKRAVSKLLFKCTRVNGTNSQRLEQFEINERGFTKDPPFSKGNFRCLFTNRPVRSLNNSLLKN